MGWARLGWLAGWVGLAGLGWLRLGWAWLAGLGWPGWADWAGLGWAWLGWARESLGCCLPWLVLAAWLPGWCCWRCFLVLVAVPLR